MDLHFLLHREIDTGDGVVQDMINVCIPLLIKEYNTEQIKPDEDAEEIEVLFIALAPVCNENNTTNVIDLRPAILCREAYRRGWSVRILSENEYRQITDLNAKVTKR